jgi:hypothetical protein
MAKEEWYKNDSRQLLQEKKLFLAPGLDGDDL